VRAGGAATPTRCWRQVRHTGRRGQRGATGLHG
jgi:hypothetical protein